MGLKLNNIPNNKNHIVFQKNWICVESDNHKSEMDFMISNVSVIKPEPETIPEEGSSISHCNEILPPGIVKQETEDTSVIKCEPGTLTVDEHAQECDAYSDIDINSSDIKKEFFINLERIDQGSGKIFNFSDHEPEQP